MNGQLDPYNPLDKANLGASVANALISCPAAPLDGLQPFEGAGIYAIYYSGGYAPYAPISKQNSTDKRLPIYVGKAVPSGARRGISQSRQSERSLYKRLVEHAESIACVDNLALSDFSCRYLVVDDIWIPLGESLLIQKFAPLWNSVIDGFGNHDPGRGRYNGMRPRWDMLHVGRSWAQRCQPRNETVDDILAAINRHLSSE